MRLTLSQASVRFRGRIIDALVRTDREGFWYIEQDTCAGKCPVCGGVLSIYFAGYAPRAEILCRAGCGESEIVAALARLTEGGRA